MTELLQMIPANYRKVIYAVLTALLAVYGVWRAVDGDWEQFVVSLFSAATTGMATANTFPEVESE